MLKQIECLVQITSITITKSGVMTVTKYFENVVSV